MVFLLGPQTKWQPLEILHNNPHPQLRHVFEQNQLNEKMGGGDKSVPLAPRLHLIKFQVKCKVTLTAFST